MAKMTDIELLRAAANGEQLRTSLRTRVLLLAAEHGIEVKKSRCPSCFRDAALQVYHIMAKKNAAIDSDTAVYTLKQGVNFNGKMFGNDTPSEVVRDLVRKGLPKRFYNISEKEQSDAGNE